MKFDTKDIKAKAKENFEKTWLETAKLLPDKSGKDYSSGNGKSHPLHALIQDVRKIFFNLGFDETENSVFVPEEEVYYQYGPEAPVILDRCYYLAGLPRPDIGLGKEKIDKILSINQSIRIEKLQELLRGYREGAIEGDNLFGEMVGKLSIGTEDAARIIEVFPEFRSLTAVSEKMTLRSHMTAAWFPTLKALQGKQEMPVKLFSIGLRFRREQKVDATHLRAHYGASCVIMDPEISLEAGKKVSEKMLERMNFRDLSFETKKATSNYYAPGTELEIFSHGIEVGNLGMYSPVALANYGIEYPVFNIGFGLERILMIRRKQTDVREVLYPQFYKVVEFSDKEVAEQVRIDKAAKTHEGTDLAARIIKAFREHGAATSPCKFNAYTGKFLGRDIEVSVLEREEGTTLLGPAAANEIYVYQGGIYGLPKEDSGKLKEDLSEVREKGVHLGFTFLDAVSSLFAFQVEEAVEKGLKLGFFQVKMAKNPSDVNIFVSDVARRFVSSRNKPISLKGPVFVSVEFLIR